MSDFDKEAEREKLREKYEQDQQEREVAEKMSELLLQGATMTNAHCSECGDPIFRYDGQEFCATCEQAVDRDAGDAADETDASEDENIEVTAPDESARVQFGAETDAPETGGDQPQQSQQPAQSQDTQHSAGTHQQTPQSRQETANRQSQPPRQPSQSREVPGLEPDAQADIATARESLVRTLTRFSQQAEATDDPQRASDYLAAAREAAETLSALRQ